MVNSGTHRMVWLRRPWLSPRSMPPIHVHALARDAVEIAEAAVFKKEHDPVVFIVRRSHVGWLWTYFTWIGWSNLTGVPVLTSVTVTNRFHEFGPVSQTKKSFNASRPCRRRWWRHPNRRQGGSDSSSRGRTGPARDPVLKGDVVVAAVTAARWCYPGPRSIVVEPNEYEA